MNDLIKLPEISSNTIAAIATEEGLKPFLDYAKAIAEDAAKEVNDANTEKGRKAIGSLANKVSTSKTAISKCGAEYVKLLKAQPVSVQKTLKAFYDDMDAIRDSIKAPADEWKAKEKARIDGLYAEIAAIGDLASRACAETGETYSADKLTENRQLLSAMTFGELTFGDLHKEAMETWSQALEFLDAAIKERTGFENALAESERLKAELAEANKQAEIEKAKADAKAEASQEASKEVAQANLRAEQAEAIAQARVDADKKAEDDAYKADQAEIAAKAANTEHQRKVNNTTMNELMQCCEGLTDKQAKMLITNFVKGNFSHITINY